MRVGSIIQMTEKMISKINDNNFFARPENYNYDNQLRLKYGSNAEYEYEDGILYLEHDAIRKVVAIKTIDIGVEVVDKIHELMKLHNISIQNTTKTRSSKAEHEERMKKELCAHTRYNIDSMVPYEYGGKSTQVQLVKWEDIKNLSMDQVHVLKWENRWIDWISLDIDNLSEPFLREFQDKVNWFRIARKTDTLSEKFKTEFKDKLSGS